MASPGPVPPSHITDMIYLIVGIVIATVVVKLLRKLDRLNAIPTVGPSNWLETWWFGLTFQKNGLDIIQQGYETYKYKPFKVAYQWRWLVVISSREHIEEVRNAPQDQLSVCEAIRDRLSVDYTVSMGKELHFNPYHVSMIRSQLNRNLETLCPEIKDEIVTSFEDVLDLKCDGWKSVPAFDTIRTVVSRTSNRPFVGLPLCRDPGWMELNIQNAADVVDGWVFLQRFPTFLKTFVTHFIKDPARNNARGMQYLGPIIEERQKCLDKFGDSWVEKPNDFLSWMMDFAEGEERTPKFLTTRLMLIALVSLHSTSHSFTHALFYLAANPQYVQPLREEVEAIVAQEGWSKTALRKMRLIDSFLKENQRLKGISAGKLLQTLSRKAMKDFTFSDGTFIPEGTLISAATGCVHADEDHYENAKVFDPFRFAKMQDGVGEDAKNQFISTSPEYLAFGHGKYACPGRFFVANEMKIMLAHIILTYDVKLDDSAGIPESIHLSTTVLADSNAKVMFRKRK